MSHIDCIQLTLYSVKSSWELVFIVIHKPNSNKLFLSSYLINNHKQQYLQLDSGVKVSVQVLMGSCSSLVRPKTIQLVFFASLLGSGHYSDSPLLRRPIIPTAHCSDGPFLRQPIIPSKMVKSSIIILKPVVFLLYLTEDWL